MVKSFYQTSMTKDSRNLLWIVGEGGLLGSSLRSISRNHSDGYVLWSPPSSFAWDEPLTLYHQFQKHIQAFQSEAAHYPFWTILWAAGAGVIGSSDTELKMETNNLTLFIEELSNQTTGNFQKGHFFLASSAGGVWGGAQSFPISEETPCCPISEYGRQKLKQEGALIGLAKSHPEFKVMIGRISNLYGTRQNLKKPQGLLSQLCRSTLLRVPINIFVPLETVRDYIFVDDCAELIFKAMEKLSTSIKNSNVIIKIFASEEPTSIGMVLNHLQRLTRREAMIICPQQSLANQQPKELSFKSKLLMDTYTCRSISEGLKTLLDYQESLLQSGELPYPEAG